VPAFRNSHVISQRSAPRREKTKKAQAIQSSVNMAASAKKKREKKKDFQRAKLKVGKTKAKPDSFTSTSFKAKGIVQILSGHEVAQLLTGLSNRTQSAIAQYNYSNLVSPL
jgi:hypothetical protein